MKKLLSLLGIIGLVATSTLTVVACNKTTSDEEDVVEEGTSSATIENVVSYKDALQKVWLDTYNDQESQARVITKINKEGAGDLTNSKFFNFKYLIDKYKVEEGQPQNQDLRNDKEAKEKMKNDLNIIFHHNTFSKYFKNMITLNHDKYKDIAMGGEWNETFAGFEIEDKFQLLGQKVKINAKSTSEETVELLYQITLNPTIKMYYRDESGNKDIYKTTPFEMALLIGEDGNIMQMIEVVRNELPTKVLNNPNDAKSTNFNFNALKNTNPNLKNYGHLGQPIANFLNQPTGSFKQGIKEMIDQIVADKVQGTTSELDENNTIDGKNINIEGDWLNTKKDWDVLNTINQFENNSLANNLILKDKSSNGMTEATAMDLIQKRLMKDKTLKADAYNEELTTFLKKYGIKDGEALQNMLLQISTHGTFALSNINLVFGGANGGLKLKIPTISIPWTYKNNASTNYQTKEKQLLLALYQSILFINQHLWSVNQSPTVDNTLFQISDAAKADYKKAFTMTNKIQWDDVKAKLDAGQSLAMQKGLNFEVGTHTSMIGSQLDQVIKSSQEMKFEAFTSSMEIMSNSQPLVMKKTSKGKIGLGIAKINDIFNPTNTLMNYNLKFGSIQIMLRVPFRGFGQETEPGVQWTGPITQENKANFYGSSYAHEREYYLKHAVKQDWLLLEIA
ncbi:lipoprotein [Williamsoniiplasma lucivorax]|uniref:Lipoprotein n=1 Tax=Williamsoniiplasma lucivorax TaxID=209274 RepID=A0A2S5REG1_9MOLU|nr:lipoprotein [Williamsoniiplasma lucivorax]PPE05719.1 hypothetical protein ELUCI_v1c00050 [Williamsoniiplasma lucivorax]